MTELLSGKGEIVTFTTIYEARMIPTGFDFNVPSVLALVKLTEMEKPILAQLTYLNWHLEERTVEGEIQKIEIPNVEIGMKVEMITRKLYEDGKSGVISYGYKFRPILSQES